jgi:hypothetical protein
MKEENAALAQKLHKHDALTAQYQKLQHRYHKLSTKYIDQITLIKSLKV